MVCDVGRALVGPVGQGHAQAITAEDAGLGKSSVTGRCLGCQQCAFG